MIYAVRISPPQGQPANISLKGKDRLELVTTLYAIDTYVRHLLDVAISDSDLTYDQYGDVMVNDEGQPIITLKNEQQLAAEMKDKLQDIVTQLNTNPLAHRCDLKPESFVIPMSVIETFGDTLGIDEQQWLLEQRHTTEATVVTEATDVTEATIRARWLRSLRSLRSPTRYIVALSDQDGNFHGQVWAFTRSGFPYIAMYGIRAAFIDILCRTKPPRIASSLMAGVAALARQDKTIRKLIVPWPLPSMVNILTRMGFEEHNSLQMTPEREFLALSLPLLIIGPSTYISFPAKKPMYSYDTSLK